jgi:hypothetical protein
MKTSMIRAGLIFSWMESPSVNLPTISEIHKTIGIDSKFNFYKCGDLCQMILVEEPDTPLESQVSAKRLISPRSSLPHTSVRL